MKWLICSVLLVLGGCWDEPQQDADQESTDAHCGYVYSVDNSDTDCWNNSMGRTCITTRKYEWHWKACPDTMTSQAGVVYCLRGTDMTRCQDRTECSRHCQNAGYGSDNYDTCPCN